MEIFIYLFWFFLQHVPFHFISFIYLFWFFLQNNTSSNFISLVLLFHFFITPAQICSVQIDDVELRQVNSRPIHTICGRFVEERSGIFSCDFCSSMCSCKVIRSFDLNMILADKTAKISASCNGSTAAEILQIFPDEFYMLPEVKWLMYNFANVIWNFFLLFSS